MAFNKLDDKESQLEFIRFIINEVKGTKYEEICVKLFRDFDKFNPQRIKSILENFRSQIDSIKIKPEPEPSINLQIMAIETENPQVIVIDDSDEEPQNSATATNDQHKSDDSSATQILSDEDVVISTSAQKKRRKRVIASDDSISERSKSSNELKRKRRRIVRPSSSSSSVISSTSTDDTTSYYTATASKTSDESDNFVVNSDNDSQYSSEERQVKKVKRRRISRRNRRRLKLTESDKLKEATVKSFIGREVLTLSAQRKRKRVDYNLDKESSEESESLKVWCKVPQSQRKKRISSEKIESPKPSTSTAARESDESETCETITHAPPATVADLFGVLSESSEEDDDIHPTITFASLTCNPYLRRCDYSKINGTVQVTQVNGEWIVKQPDAFQKPPTPPPTATCSDDSDDSDSPKDGPIPITRASSRSRSDRTDRSTVSIETDFGRSENRSHINFDESDDLLPQTYREALRVRNSNENNVQRNQPEKVQKVIEQSPVRIIETHENEATYIQEEMHDEIDSNSPVLSQNESNDNSDDDENDCSVEIIEPQAPEIIEIDDDAPDPVPVISVKRENFSTESENETTLPYTTQHANQSKPAATTSNPPQSNHIVAIIAQPQSTQNNQLAKQPAPPVLRQKPALLYINIGQLSAALATVRLNNSNNQQKHSKINQLAQQPQLATNPATQSSSSATAQNIPSIEQQQRQSTPMTVIPNLAPQPSSSTQSILAHAAEQQLKSPAKQLTHRPIKQSPIPKVIAEAQLKVQNIAFLKCRLGIMYKCFVSGCNYNTLNENQFKNHLRLKHANDEWTGFCNICEETSSTNTSLIMEFQHMKEHHINGGRMRSCSINSNEMSSSNCGRGGSSSVRIANIAFTKCAGQIQYNCYAAMCTFSTYREDTFKYHLQSRHPIDKWSGFCNVCNKSFSNISPLLKEFMHMKDYHINENRMSIDNANSEERRNRSRSSSKDSSKSNKSQQEQQSTTTNKPKVCKELCFSSESSASKKSTENLPEQYGTNRKLMAMNVLSKQGAQVETDARYVNKENNPNTTTQVIQNVQALATIRVPENLNSSNKAITLPVVPCTDVQTTKTTIKSVDFMNIAEENDDDASKSKPILRVKILPGDKLSNNNFPNVSSTSSEGEILPEVAALRNSFAQQLPEEPNVAQQTLIEQSRTALLQNLAQRPRIESPSITKFVITKTQPPTVTIAPKTNVSMAPPQLAPLRKIICAKSPIISTSVVPAVQNQSASSTAIKLPQGLNVHLNVPGMKSLRPWLPYSQCNKSYKIVEAMKTPACLKELYKCMHETCGFYTGNNEVFVAHSESHKNSNPLTHLNCCYCSFHTPDNKNLVDHIAYHHGKCKYFCSFCFYRTCCTFNMKRHVEKYHSNISATPLQKLASIGDLNEEQELLKIKSVIKRFISQISCSACRKKFYNYKMFENHREKEHPTGILYKCNVCQKEATELNLFSHLTKCHRIHQYQCTYCKFGSETLDDVADHLMNTHPEKLPYYCERVNTSQITDPSSIETTTIRMFTVNRSKNW